MADIIACLPQSKFAKIHWNEVLNLSMVDRIDGNIFYVGRASYSVDRKYVEDVHQTFMKVEKSNTQDVEPSSYYDAIFLRVGECYRRIRIDAIMWIESWHNYCDVHVNGSTKPYCSVLPLTAWHRIHLGQTDFTLWTLKDFREYRAMHNKPVKKWSDTLFNTFHHLCYEMDEILKATAA